MNKKLNYEMTSPLTRVSDKEILDSLKRYFIEHDEKPFTTSNYDSWIHRICTSATISKRFGSWRKALQKIGIERGIQEKEYTAIELMENLQLVWDELGRRPGKRSLSKNGFGISERPYINKWGSVKNACEIFIRYINGEISEQQLLDGPNLNKRMGIPLKVRFQVLKSNNYRCVMCGARPPDVELEVDHIVPVAKGGSDKIDNLQTLCNLCNQGKKDRTE